MRQERRDGCKNGESSSIRWLPGDAEGGEEPPGGKEGVDRYREPSPEETSQEEVWEQLSKSE